MTPQELEACVLAGLLNGGASPDAFDVIASTPEESFSIGFYRRAFSEIKKQALANGLIDMLFVSEALGGSSLADLSEITRMPATVPNLKGYAGKMVKAWRSRRMAELLQQGADGIRQANNQEQRDQVVETAVAQLLDMTGDTGDVQPVHMSELLPVYMETMQKRMDGEEGTRNLKTGIEELDDATGGINLQDLIVVAGRPGMGKTEFALKIVDGVTAVGGGALIFSMEMAAAQIVERSLAGSGNMSVSRLRNPLDMQDEDWARFTAAMETMNGRDIWIVDATDLTIEQIRAIAETHKRRYPHLAMIVVDYLGLIKKPKAERNDLAIAHISRNLKTMAMRLHTPTFALSQLSRAVDSRPAGQRRPVMSDLRDSGSIEQDADSIMFLYRDEVYNPESPAAGIAEIILGKSRFSAAGSVIYQEFKNGHFLHVDQHVGKEKTRIQLEAAKPRKQPRRYSEKYNTDSF
ncbi:TPA: replicative DNA helicase [Klebsiella variicola subsp. variicola]|uniref:replicative DNA helicase n=1 Tax=Klebsiella variicola TaxID=244366 RepID=UPI0018AD4CFE|nr:replicative DNA helicase [Klebsiella variicola]HBQ8853236.1 AAA family ATPase [Klebsiella variicola subsp. variicola]MEC5997233.1 replicative DNA helicase [Klebsiella variicola]QPJ04260.1 AAA family ATPase [Klebsiella variicola]HBQ8859804.1 AAA family ATPase [Klebsiella variicola subsp. variicola]HBQ8886424.1 AAA family ATPase [Klebsiella variicola subsp. variicola]